MKRKSGVTLIILAITIIIMMIILGITVASFNDLLKNTQRNRLKTNLYLIKARAEVLLDEYLFRLGNDAYNVSLSNIDEEALGGEILLPHSAEVKKVGFDSGNIGKIFYCKWNFDTLKSQGIDTSNIAETDEFIIEYNFGGNYDGSYVDVASVRGFSEDGETVHKLSELE